MKSSTITGGIGEHIRKELDYYPTPKECTIALMEFLKLSQQVIWEPACGDGHISMVLEKYGHTVVSTDIRNTGYGEGGVDYLTSNNKTCDAIITNPPFSLADKFIKKAINSVDTVALLLKAHYWNAKSRYELFNSRSPAYVLPLTWRPKFHGIGSPTMDFMWTVWLSGSNKCHYMPLLKPH